MRVDTVQMQESTETVQAQYRHKEGTTTDMDTVQTQVWSQIQGCEERWTRLPYGEALASPICEG